MAAWFHRLLWCVFGACLGVGSGTDDVKVLLVVAIGSWWIVAAHTNDQQSTGPSTSARTHDKVSGWKIHMHLTIPTIFL